MSGLEVAPGEAGFASYLGQLRKFDSVGMVNACLAAGVEDQGRELWQAIANAAGYLDFAAGVAADLHRQGVARRVRLAEVRGGGVPAAGEAGAVGAAGGAAGVELAGDAGVELAGDAGRDVPGAGGERLGPVRQVPGPCYPGARVLPAQPGGGGQVVAVDCGATVDELVAALCQAGPDSLALRVSGVRAGAGSGWVELVLEAGGAR